MSHVVTVHTKVRDPAAISAACRRLGLPEPLQGTAQLYNAAATGHLVQLPGWRYPIVIDVQSGEVRLDHFEGCWGNPQLLDKFLQMYAVEKAKLAARARGYAVNEQVLGDGAIRL